MAYGSKSTDHELTKLQSEITNEVHRDAEHLSTAVFGQKNTQPDLARVDNSLLDTRYRTAYQKQDRQWLLAEAQRDPLQFLEVSQRIGAYIPPEQPAPVPPTPSPPVAQPPAPAAAPVPVPPLASPMPSPLPPALTGLPAGPPMPPAAAGPPMPAAGLAIRPMAEGGLVTQPTLALIGENGPELVTPLAPGAPTVPMPVWQPPDPVIDPRDSRYYEQAVNTAVPVPGQPGPGEIEAYIRQAASARGIDPDIAVRIAFHEGGRDLVNNPAQAPFTDPAIEGRFNTGRSYWPFQLHYGGAGTPYAQWGSKPGLGNEFTAATGWQPGDPRAWQAATDWALDEALRTGWQKWYGRIPANVGVWQGVPQRTAVAQAPPGHL